LSISPDLIRQYPSKFTDKLTEVSMVRPFAIFLSLALVALWLTGCGPTNNKEVKKGDGKTEEHSHEHAYEGPHGGHLVELAEPGKENKEEYHAEWTHDDASGKVTVYILDGKAKETVPISAETVTIKVKSGDNTDSHELAAVYRTTGDKPTSFKFEIENKELLGKLETLKAVTATVHIDVNGKPYEGKIEEEHEHAGHKH
jgi:hypothetical protein